MAFFNRPWLLIEVDNIDARIQLLRDHRIPFAVASVTEPRRASGITVPKKYAPEVLALFTIAKENFREFVTNDKRILLYTPYSVTTTESEHIEHWSQLETVFTLFAKRQKLHIDVSIPHGDMSKPANEPGTLSFRFYSIPETETTQFTTLPVAFGILLDEYQQDGYFPTRLGSVLTDPMGVPVAEIVDTTVFILFDLSHGSHAYELLQNVLNEFEISLLPQSEQVRVKENRLRELRDASRKRYIEACEERYTNQRDNTKETITKLQNQQNELSKKLTASMREEQIKLQLLELLELIGHDEKAKFLAEYERLIAMPKVRDVIVVGSTITVQTQLLTGVDYEGVKRQLGEYSLYIPTDGGIVTLKNHTRIVEGQLHPYSNSDHTVCFGNISEPIQQLIASYEYSVVAQLIIEFLEASVHDKTMRDWPKVEEGAEHAAQER